MKISDLDTTTKRLIVEDVEKFARHFIEDYECEQDRKIQFELVSHIIACCVVQWFPQECPLGQDGVGTAETRDFFYHGAIPTDATFSHEFLNYLRLHA